MSQLMMVEVLAALVFIFGPLAWLLFESVAALRSSSRPEPRTLPILAGGSDGPPDAPRTPSTRTT